MARHEPAEEILHFGHVRHVSREDEEAYECGQQRIVDLRENATVEQEQGRGHNGQHYKIGHDAHHGEHA